MNARSRLDLQFAPQGPMGDAVRGLKMAREQQAIALDRVQSVARMYLIEVLDDKAELLSRAAWIYWFVQEVPSATIAEVVCGPGSAPIHLTKVLPKVIAVQCQHCDTQEPVRSRNHMARVQEQRSLNNFRCASCYEADRKQEEAERIERQEASENRLEELRQMSYGDYLLTPEWKDTRDRKLKSAGFRCQLCNQGGSLNVHHSKYGPRGMEWLSTLIVLCRPCHAKHHGKPE